MFIQQEILSAWTTGRRTKSTATGWISANAVCCHHNGQTADQRGRGGMLPTQENGVSYHCFNCGFTANWQPGRRINLKMRKLLAWMGVGEDEIRRLSLFALGQLDTSLDIKKEVIRELPKFECKEICPGHNLLDWFIMQDISQEDLNQAMLILDYVDSRGLGDKMEYFKWHNDKTTHVYNRVLVPFTWLSDPMGYSGRSIVPTKRKYYTEHPPHFVFNYDKQQQDAKFCLVVEGVLDAIAVDGISILTNECSESQAHIIDSLNREVVVVPDRDKAGMELVRHAMDYGWNVAFPDWGSNIKDCSDAVQQYGQLFTMRSVLNSVETSNLKIQLMMKRWLDN
jgi:hypothetical protein